MKFTETHEWIDVRDGVGVVGISDHAQKELGEIVYAELPIVDKEIKGGQQIAVLESTKAAADVYSPVSGKILEVNASLKDFPELINQSPEKEGWLYKVRLSDIKELDKLSDEQEYLAKFS